MSRQNSRRTGLRSRWNGFYRRHRNGLRFIKALMADETPEIELRRNELAEHFQCAPSQINYVLATRFTPDHGYVIESRRGGGGYIRIVRMEIGRASCRERV